MNEDQMRRLMELVIEGMDQVDIIDQLTDHLLEHYGPMPTANLEDEYPREYAQVLEEE
tara:strand:+ start:1568 stop:1741 length:174 start_codon:yes stop_codon:yes gene_type:complete